jgi:hypothetical protein
MSSPWRPSLRASSLRLQFSIFAPVSVRRRQLQKHGGGFFELRLSDRDLEQEQEMEKDVQP